MAFAAASPDAAALQPPMMLLLLLLLRILPRYLLHPLHPGRSCWAAAAAGIKACSGALSSGGGRWAAAADALPRSCTAPALLYYSH